MRTPSLFVFASFLVGCWYEPQPAAVPQRIACGVGTVKGPTDAGEMAACVGPLMGCDPQTEVVALLGCGFPAVDVPAEACCAKKPETCAPTDCECLERDGPWVVVDPTDFDAGSPNRMSCRYYSRLFCHQGLDGGAATIVCTRP